MAITTTQRKQILVCKDNAQLDARLRAAAAAPNVHALLSGVVPVPPRSKGRFKAT